MADPRPAAAAPPRPRSPPRPSSKSTKKDRIPSTPPLLIRDVGRQSTFHRLGLLGEGGFARVYEVQDDGGRRHAFKVVSKKSLQTTKTKTKLYAEIKLHKMLDHPNIVGFKDCFDDDENVYMGLELCEKGSMMDLLRRRKGLTEPEIRYYLVQLIGACLYMHGENVIHRDLKLGNIFLDARMDVKVGDFGLAALIEKEGERKKTICGTPNYIAPEVLFDTANGHSFEVDVWSIGVILYTLIIGKPPFQTKEIKAIYKRIRDNQYDFPPEKPISPEARDLIQDILTVNPNDRPTLHTILQHPFFTAGHFPSSLPSSSAECIPDFSHLTAQQSSANFARVRARATQARPIATSRVRPSMGPSVAQQEREFQRAVQPESPLSTLLSSAVQPLLVSHEPRPKDGNLLNKLTHVARTSTKEARSSPLRNQRAPLDVLGEEGPVDNIVSEPLRQRELDGQKARLVADLAKNFPEATTAPLPRQDTADKYGRRLVAAPPPTSYGKENDGGRSALPAHKPSSSSASSSRYHAHDAQPTAGPSKPSPDLANGQKISGGVFDVFSRNLCEAFESRDAGRPSETAYIAPQPPMPKNFIVSWLDYCNKYGMGYALTDGSVGVHFNDSTSIILAPDKEHFDYISAFSKQKSSVLVRRNYTLGSFPDDLSTKIYLLKHFQGFMQERLLYDKPYCFTDAARTKGMDFVQRYLRMKHVIVFKLSHDVLQFNFYDHTKLILSSRGLVVTYINKDSQLSTWSLDELLRPDGLGHDRKVVDSIVKKVKYVKVLLGTIRSTSAAAPVSSSASSAAASESVGVPPVAHRTPTLIR